MSCSAIAKTAYLTRSPSDGSQLFAQSMSLSLNSRLANNYLSFKNTQEKL